MIANEFSENLEDVTERLNYEDHFKILQGSGPAQQELYEVYKLYGGNFSIPAYGNASLADLSHEERRKVSRIAASTQITKDIQDARLGDLTGQNVLSDIAGDIYDAAFCALGWDTRESNGPVSDYEKSSLRYRGATVAGEDVAGHENETLGLKNSFDDASGFPEAEPEDAPEWEPDWDSGTKPALAGFTA